MQMLPRCKCSQMLSQCSQTLSPQMLLKYCQMIPKMIHMLSNARSNMLSTPPPACFPMLPNASQCFPMLPKFCHLLLAEYPQTLHKYVLPKSCLNGVCPSSPLSLPRMFPSVLQSAPKGSSSTPQPKTRGKGNTHSQRRGLRL